MFCENPRIENWIVMSHFDEEVNALCEEEFQCQMEATDGELVIWIDDRFQSISLAEASMQSQIVLSFFANCLCPVSGLRFALTLYPFEHSKWPLSSRALSIQYTLQSLQSFADTLYNSNASRQLNDFKKSSEFISLMCFAKWLLKNSQFYAGLDHELKELLNMTPKPQAGTLLWN